MHELMATRNLPAQLKAGVILLHTAKLSKPPFTIQPVFHFHICTVNTTFLHNGFTKNTVVLFENRAMIQNVYIIIIIIIIAAVTQTKRVNYDDVKITTRSAGYFYDNHLQED